MPEPLVHPSTVAILSSSTKVRMNIIIVVRVVTMIALLVIRSGGGEGLSAGLSDVCNSGKAMAPDHQEHFLHMLMLPDIGTRLSHRSAPSVHPSSELAQTVETEVPHHAHDH